MVQILILTTTHNANLTLKDLKWPQVTPWQLKQIPNQMKKNRNILKAGYIQENIEINEHYLDEILHNNNSQRELAMQIIPNDKTVRSDTVEYLKEYYAQSLATRAKKGEKLDSMMPPIKEAFNLLGDDIVELSTENETLKNKKVDYDEKWLEESKARLLRQIDDEERANFIMSRLKKQMEKHWKKWILYFITFRNDTIEFWFP